MKSERRGKFGERKEKALLFVVLFATLAFISVGCASADTIYVPEGGNQTIQQAVNNASAGDTIIVRDGTYTENVDVYKRLTIESENGSASTIVQAANPDDHVFNISAGYVNITGFTIRNGTMGVYLASDNNVVKENNITDMTGVNGVDAGDASNNPGGVGSGVYLSGSTNNTITNNTVSSITGGKGGNSSLNYKSGGVGGVAAGIYLSSATSNNLTSNIISSLTGGTGGTGGYEGSGGTGGLGGSGGTSSGIYLSSSTNNNLTSNTILGLTGGTGGTGGTQNSAGTGGTSLGIYLVSSTNNSLTSNIILGLIGGMGGTGGLHGSGGTGGATSGIYLSSSTNNNLASNIISSLMCGKGGVGSSGGSEGTSAGVRMATNSYNNRITTLTTQASYKVPDSLKWNVIEGKPILYFYNETSLNVSNFNITTNTTPILIGGSTATGKSGGTGGISTGLTLINTTNSIIENNTISGFDGMSGGTGKISGSGGTGGISVGIYLSGSIFNNLTSNILSDLIGGHGGTGGQGWSGTGGTGGISAGIYISGSGSINNNLKSNTISNLMGGKSGTGGFAGSGGTGGTSTGIFILSSTNNNLTSNAILSLTGGMGGAGANHGPEGCCSGGTGGTSTGIYLSGSTNTNLASNTISNLTGGSGGTKGAYGSAGSLGTSRSIHCSQSSSTVINNNTLTTSDYGIYLENSDSNILLNDTLYNNTQWDFYSDANSHNNSINDLTISSYPTTISFTYDLGIRIKSVETAPPDPVGKANISKYVNAANVTQYSWIFLNVSYTDADVSGVVEDSLRLYKWNETALEWEFANETGEPNGVNIDKNYVYANVTSFSQITPFGNPEDATPPTITFVAPTPANNSEVTVNYVFVNITLDETGSTALLNWNGTNETMLGAGTNFFLNKTNLADGDYTYKVYANDTLGNMGVSETRMVTVNVTVPDATSPASITNLINITYESTYINWTWINPPDADFSTVMVYLNGTFKTNVSTPTSYYNATGLTPETSYELGTRTVDTSVNINATWVNHTAMTAATPTLLPVHNLNTGENFSMIQAAIYDPDTDSGHTITVDAGTYNENVRVNKSLTIKSTSGNPADTTVQAGDSSKHVFKVTADYVNISGFTVKGATEWPKAGIYLGSNVDHCNISNNNVSNNGIGIKLYESINNTITGNNVSNNDWIGISLKNSSNNNIITGNTASNNNRPGIWLKNSNNNTITGNTATNNGRCGIGLNISSNNNTITGNTASNNEWSGIGLKNSSNNTLIGNTANNNKRAGIGLNISSSNNNITGNTLLSNNKTGITLKSSNNNTICNNNASLNNETGIWLNQSSNNNLTNNTASNNGQFGIWLRRSPYNTLRENVMDHNGIVNLIGKDNPTVEDWDNDIDPSNTVNGLPVYYFYNQSDLVIDTFYITKRILIAGCNNITVRNICYHDGDPIALVFTNNSLVENCTVSNNNAIGFLLIWSHYNNLTNNSALNNEKKGFCLQADSSRNNITNNIITGNGEWGIKLHHPTSNNTICNNYFNNTNNAYDDGTNIWNISKTAGTNIIGGSWLGGNYWSDYVGEDLDDDGLGDTLLPYNSSGNIQNGGDWLPLVRALEPPHARFSLHKNFNMHTQDDSITNATYDADLGYHLQIDNEDDGSDTVLSNLTFSIQSEKNITDVDWRKYAKWNESYAEWRFPPKFVVEENEGFGLGVGTDYSEPKYFNLNISRWFNETSFNETAHQRVNFSLEFEDKNFEWLWGSVGAREHEEVYASIVPGTFETNAPIEWTEIYEKEHEIHFDFNKSALQSGVTYNFSFIVKVKPRRPIIYKPDITIGEGLYHSSTAGETGFTAEMPASMLPENVSYAAVSTNVSNTWRFERVSHLITGLGEVVTPTGPHAKFEFNRDFKVRTEDDSITSGTYEHKIKYGMGIHNEDDDSDTVLGNFGFYAQADNVTEVKWEKYATWNESSVNWAFPSKFDLHEGDWHWTGFKTNYSETRYLNVNTTRLMNQTVFNNLGYQLAKFNVTFEDTNFKWVWARIEANNHHEIGASIVPGTFTYDAPVNDFDEWDHGIHFNFDKERIEPCVTYNFSVLIKVELTGKEAPPVLYKPKFRIGKGLYYNSTTGTGNKIEIPAEMLPDNVSCASVSTNVSNAWLIKRHNHIIAGLDEVVKLVGPHAELHFNRDFIVRTEGDSITNGTCEGDKWYGLHIDNDEDTSGAALSYLSFNATADNITDVAWERYAEWNESSVDWNFPAYPRFIIEEGDGFGIGFSRGSETRDVNMNVSRWMNKTEFNSSAYQLAEFNVTFDDTNFEWVWARIEANERHEIDASIVTGTFTYDAPVNDFDEWDHGIHFDFDEERIEPGVTYNFSVLIKVELTGKEAPPILYKPQFRLGEGLYYNSTTGTGNKIEIPAEMLPDNVSYASVSTNVSNAWLIKRHNHTIAGLEEVSELIDAHAVFTVAKVFPVMTENDTIDSGTYERNMGCMLHIKNSDDSSDTVLGDLKYSAQADNITDAAFWEEHAVWNKTSVSWTFPSEDFVIYEDEWFGAGFGMNVTEIRHVNVDLTREMNQTLFNESAYQLANFTVTFEDTDFQWCGGRIVANEHYEVNATIVPGTFETDAPLDWVNEWEHRVGFGFNRDAIETGVPYNFSVVINVDLIGDIAPPIVYKPQFDINVELDKFFAPGGVGFAAEMPPEMLPSYVNNASVTTNVSNNWTLRQVNRTIARLKEVYGSTRIEAILYNGYIISLPAMPNITSSPGIHDNYKFADVELANPTGASILSPSISLLTEDPIIDYNIESRGVKEFSYEYVAENASKLNWSLYDVPPHIQQHEGYGSLIIMSEMVPKDHGFNASVSVDKFEFSTPSEQTLNVTIDVYDNSSMEILFFQTYTPDFDFVSAEFVNWTSDTPPEDFESRWAHWWIENPEERRYTFLIKLNVTPYLSCVYRSGVNVFNWNTEETLVNSSSEVVVENTLAGNYTLSIGETRDWRVIKNVLALTEFPAIATENYTTISGYVKDDNGKPIGNTLVFVNIWNESESEYQDYVETSTNESGYYVAYVKSNEKYKIIAGGLRSDYTTEEVENITILPRIENFTLHNASVVCGGVFGTRKKPMQGVKVMVVNESNITINSESTNEDGYYRQLKIPEYGNYTVKVGGYDSNELELSDVGKGKAILHNFVVEPLIKINSFTAEVSGYTLNSAVNVTYTGESEATFVVVVSGVNENTGVPIYAVGTIKFISNTTEDVLTLGSVPIADKFKGEYKLFAGVYSYREYPYGKLDWMGPEKVTV